MTEPEPTPATARAKTRPAGAAPLITSETAAALAVKGAAKRRENAARRKEEAAQARTAARTIAKLETDLGEARAVHAELKADARAARAETAALRRRLEAVELARADLERRAAAGTPRTVDPADAVDQAALGAMKTLRAVLGALATAARTGELWRSGADAAALLDAVVRAAAAVQALQDRAATMTQRRPAVSATSSATSSPGDLGQLAERLRSNLAAAGVVVESTATP